MDIFVWLAKLNLNENDFPAICIVNKIATDVPWYKMSIWHNVSWEDYTYLQGFLRQHNCNPVVNFCEWISFVGMAFHWHLLQGVGLKLVCGTVIMIYVKLQRLNCTSRDEIGYIM